MLGEESDATPPVTILCQDRLDFDEALRFNELCLKSADPWLWLTSGPMNRGYVSPAFLPDAGPCLACLLMHSQRLSPAAELYADLIDHAQKGGEIRSVPFPPRGIAILQQMLLWKVELLQQPAAPAALFQLHVLEVDSLEITAHRVFCDPECPACLGHR
jgi:bacteriocin biosynthesis cyclodehydratase domain-containing protein